MSDSQPTLDQRRAQHAWKAVEGAGKSQDPKDFAREAKRLPVRIKTAGLGQALAFLLAKAKSGKDGGDHRSRLLEELGDWLLEKRKVFHRPNVPEKNRVLVQAIVEGNANQLRRATEEALLYLQWLTRFSEAEFKPDEGEGNAGR